ncbi:ferrous iron transporter B [Bulleidia sp. zg-1006]|uniref:ferrous iron transporter B n=1 Tax=Bulleidia sp. zg-1006 TaxID=2806552 RepID=UPI00193A1E14|nr:ferrous iron transporter B [Bulleidia sp. zg-1006]QRG87207.1 ferrous iron transporter B [Bulleidia sp. zg-1006]
MSKNKVVIALAGNPNSGKTTLFNSLTGANQTIGNWPGVTVEKKEGKLKKHHDVIIEDLPGIYSLSPYTLEEVVSRNYLVKEKPSAILNIIDGTNLERNLYLTSQLMELGLPVVVAVNMMDLVDKQGDKIDLASLQAQLGCPVVPISALKGTNVPKAMEVVLEAVKKKELPTIHRFTDKVENFLTSLEEQLVSIPSEQKRWYAIKLFEKDEKVLETIDFSAEQKQEILTEIEKLEAELGDDSESIITDERYNDITKLLSGIYKKNNSEEKSISDKIDTVVTNRWLGLPIFALIMFIVYFCSIQTFGTKATDWVNDGLFGDGWFWLGKGRAEFDEASANFSMDSEAKEAFENEAIEKGLMKKEGEEVKVLDQKALEKFTVSTEVHDESGKVVETRAVDFKTYEKYAAEEEPDAHDFGPYQVGLPVILGDFLKSIHTSEWVQGLVLDGILAGVGSVLGFLPQMLTLFFFLAFLEGCGYMARIAFVLDRLFRRFGLSGKSFIPMLVGTGCSVPGIMASRTIESNRDRRMTVMTTSFMPCSAKLPVIALISGAFFKESGLVATSSYFLGIAAIVVSGIMLKKTKRFAGDPAPFVMELPAYHWPTPSYILHSMWERGFSFVKKAGTIIFLASVFIWLTSHVGYTAQGFAMVEEADSLLAMFGNAVKFIFAPLGFGDWRAAVATVTGLIAKENVVSTMGVLYGAGEVSENGWQIYQSMNAAFFGSALAGYCFLVFNLLCAPCFAAIGAIRREMNDVGWTWFAIAYQCGFAYVVALMIYQFGLAIQGKMNMAGFIVAVVIAAAMLYQLFKPMKKHVVVE